MWGLFIFCKELQNLGGRLGVVTADGPLSGGNNEIQKGIKAFVHVPESGGRCRATKTGESSVWKVQSLLGRQGFLFSQLN